MPLHGKFFRTIADLAGVIPGVGSTISTVAGILAGKERATQLKYGTTALVETGRPNGGCGVGRMFNQNGQCIPIPGFGGGPGPGPCKHPLVRGPTGLCIAPTSPLGASRLVGEAVMGRYGAALVPGSMIIDRAVCLRGMQLGDDGLCYNRGNITNKQRMWPAGRKPLLTGGEMRAISTAARAGRRMDLATKRLRKMGMMRKPPAPRQLAPHKHARAATDVVSV